MMNPDPTAAHQALLKARQALQGGDRPAARRWAELAASLDPGQEEPWLILASLASPRASVAYLEQVLKINPGSKAARQGMRWAADRLRREKARSPVRNTGPSSMKDTQPEIVAPATLPKVAPENSPSTWSLTRYRRSYLTLLLLLVCGIAAWTMWPGNALPAMALIRNSIVPQFTSTEPGGPAQVDKPTYTPTITLTPTPTFTFTPSPTFTQTQTPTDTPLPTATNTPLPTLAPTDTLLPQTASNSDPYGQFTGLSGTGERWIDVNLSQQTLYAYEGNTLVASFLVSTGVWQFPTVTGQFHIYVKYLYTDMAGIGYYLPNVPYTMYFYKGYGIHGTYWHHNFGHPMSHGCVNMYTPDAAWMFNFASVGTLVNIHY